MRIQEAGTGGGGGGGGWITNLWPSRRSGRGSRRGAAPGGSDPRMRFVQSNGKKFAMTSAVG
ncbi:MAG: hypothetical protein ACK55Z_18920, partial [bacterium]